MSEGVGCWHIVSAEFPPRVGGVSDHTVRIASALAEAGDVVHIWTGEGGSVRAAPAGVSVHPDAGAFSPRDLRRLGKRLNAHPKRRRIFVQWVPHSYGYRSLNLPFCFWLLSRALRGDRVEVMVHEPGLPFRFGGVLWNVGAAVHRLMAIVLLLAASRVWVSAPRWGEMWRRYDLRRRRSFRWLPLPNGIPIVRDEGRVRARRAAEFPEGASTIGYFGLSPGAVEGLLRAWLLPVLAAGGSRHFLLIGKESVECRKLMVHRHPELEPQIHATGPLGRDEVSVALQACDVLVQPFEGGVNARRSSVVAALEHGLPVVTTRGRFTEPFWEEYDAVVLVDEGTPADAGRVVEALLDEPEARSRLGERAKTLYREVFDIRLAVSALRGTEE